MELTEISKERLDRFDYEEKHPCPGKLKHVCIQCGESYDCYACPDIVNPSYSQTTCRPCLIKLIRGEGEDDRRLSEADD